MVKTIERAIMKRIITILYVIFLYSLSLCSSDFDHNFQRGNVLYQDGQYTKAINKYKLIEDKGFAVFYNMALAYAHREMYVQALIHCKRAEKHATFQELTAIDDLISWIYNECDIPYKQSWYDQVAVFCRKCILSTPILLLQIILLLFLVCIFGCWYKKWLYDYRLFILIWVLLLLIKSSLVYKANFLEREFGIVKKEVIPVLSGPENSFYKKNELRAFDEVIIVEKQNEYCRVRCHGFVGWVDQSDIEVV